MRGAADTDPSGGDARGSEPESLEATGNDPITLMVLAVTGVAMLVAFFGSMQSVLRILPLALPWALIAYAAVRGRVPMTTRSRRQFEIVVVFGFAAPSAMLAVAAFVRALLHDDLSAIVAPSVVLAAVAAAALVIVLPGARVLPALPVAVVGCLAYGYGGTVTANVLFDRSQPRLEQAQVTDKWVGTRSSRRPASEPPLMLALETYGPVRVDAALHERAKVGSAVCVRVRDGAMGIEWFTVERCE